METLAGKNVGIQLEDKSGIFTLYKPSLGSETKSTLDFESMSHESTIEY